MSTPRIDSLDLRPKIRPSAQPIRFDSTAPGRSFRRSGASIQGTLSNWVTQLVSRRTSESERRKLSNRAWDLYLNDAMAHGIIEGLVTEVIGTGLTPQAQPMLSWLGRDSEWQKEWQERIAAAFEIWGLDPRNWCDATGRQNIYMLQALALFHWKLDGLALFQVIRSTKGSMRPFNLRLLSIDPARLITPSDMQNRDDICDGLVLDSEGQIKSAWIVKGNSRFKGVTAFNPSAVSGDCTEIPVIDSRTGLPNLLIVCDVRNVSEYRQDSVMGPVMKELRDNNDFVDAALVKALISNLFAGFIEDTYGQTGDRAPSDWADRVQELEKGTLIIGRSGEKFQEIPNTAPGPNFEIMFQSIIKRLGMATCRGPENIAREYKASYSASQASLENAARFDETDRQVIINRFCQPTLMWLEYEAALRGLLDVGSIDDFKSNLYAYTRAAWLPPPIKVIDKAKSAKADETGLANNTRTYSDIYGERSEDWRVKLRQRAVEKQYVRELENEYGVTMEPEAQIMEQQLPVEPQEDMETTDE